MIKKKILICLCVIIGLYLCACNSNKYEGNGVTYLSKEKKETCLNVYNFINGKNYKEKLGVSEEIFWLTSTVYENETVCVDNENRVYILSDELKKYNNIADNIMSILKIEEQYMIISQKKDECFIEVWDSEFTNMSYQTSVKGTFYAAYEEGENIYFTVYDETSYEFSALYQYNVDTKKLETILLLDEAIAIYPFVFNENVYAAYNKKFTIAASEDVLELYKVENKMVNKIMSISQQLKKVIVTEDTAYALLGLNHTILCKMDIEASKIEELHNINAEGAKGMYLLNGELYIITDNALYQYIDNGLKRKIYLDSSLMSEFM